MNVENVMKLRDRLSRLNNPNTFGMLHWCRRDDECGTVACLAGHAVMEAMPDVNVVEWWHTAPDASIMKKAKEWLDLDAETAANMFIPSEAAMKLATVEDGIAALDHLLATGGKFNENWWDARVSRRR